MIMHYLGVPFSTSRLNFNLCSKDSDPYTNKEQMDFESKVKILPFPRHEVRFFLTFDLALARFKAKLGKVLTSEII